MNCDYCLRPATSLAGEANGVLVCEDHARPLMIPGSDGRWMTDADLAVHDAATADRVRREVLTEAADSWPEDGMTRTEAQQWLTARIA